MFNKQWIDQSSNALGLGMGISKANRSPASTTSISPTSVVQNGAPTTLTVNGTNFTGASIIYIDAVAQTTTFVTSIQVTCPLASQGVAGDKLITVDGSNAQTLTVTPA